MNFLIYPFKKMSITQNYEGNISHFENRNGIPADFPFDDNGGSTEQSQYFYCPCDSMIVKRIYGVGNKGTNTIWLESTNKVITPSFEDYVTILITHAEDKDLKNIKVNQIFNRYNLITLEGKDGNATGYHFHVSVGRGKFKGNGWIKNSKGAWVINTTKGAIKPEHAFFINKSFTNKITDSGLKFEVLPKKNIAYITAYSLNVRKGPGLEFQIINTLPKKTQINIIDTINGWNKIGVDQWISGDYISYNKPAEIYYTKEVLAYWLNVRKKPNGTILDINAPIPMYTKVAIIEETKYWSKINNNRWVYTNYLK